MKKFQSKVEKIDIILVLVILILVILVLVVVTKYFGNKKAQQSTPNPITVQEEDNRTSKIQNPTTDEDKIKYLATLNERDRIDYYCWEYLNNIQEGDYASAYSLLYDEFKQSYFPTVEKFEEYAKTIYPYNFAVEYDDISRQGDIYVVRIIIEDIMGSRENEKVQRLVVKENDYNNFAISFQVI